LHFKDFKESMEWTLNQFQVFRLSCLQQMNKLNSQGS